MADLESHQLAGAFLANTLERLSALIGEQGEDFLRHAGVEFPPRAVSTVLLLGESEPMSTADIARAVGRPHQLVSQRVDLLLELGVVSCTEDAGDARRKLLRLTPKGRTQFRRLVVQLALAQAAFQSLYDEIGADLMTAAVDAMAALRRSPLLERVQSLSSSSPEGE